MATNTFGFELLEKAFKEDLKKREDHYVMRVHWALVQKGLRCVGLGDKKELKGDEKGSELLPDGWSDSSSYCLRYLSNNKLYILRVTIMGDDALVNLIKADDMKIGSLVLPMEPEGKPASISLEKLHKDFENDIFTKIGLSTKEVAPKEPTVRTLLVETNRPRPDYRLGYYPGIDPCPLSVGRSDLDPLGGFAPLGGGGGMLFQPNRAPYPGVRFDPLGPSPDHMRPPRDLDDYFG